VKNSVETTRYSVKCQSCWGLRNV